MYADRTDPDVPLSPQRGAQKQQQRGTTLAFVCLIALIFLYLVGRGLESMADSAMLPAAYHPGQHKALQITMASHSGNDFPCDDADGADKTSACQIRCGRPCIEPYRLCLAYPECRAISINADLTFATLKRGLYGHVAASASTTTCTSLSCWQAWWQRETRQVLPMGSYSSGCGGCAVEVGVLSCASCARDDGSHVASTAPVPLAECLFGYANVDGSLVCIGATSKGTAAQQAGAQQPPSAASSATSASASSPSSAVTATAAASASASAAAMAFHDAAHPPKRMHVTMRNGAGADYPCDDSDGPDKNLACQIECVRPLPCHEPYRLCLAHAECSGLAMNADLSFATLKRYLYPSILPSAAELNSAADWRSYLSNMSSHFDGRPRDLWLTLGSALANATDFHCPDSDDDDDESSCRIQCILPHCTEAYAACIAHAQCAAIELEVPDLGWATLKTAPEWDASTLVAAAALANRAGHSMWGGSKRLANVSEWHIAYRAASLAANATDSNARALVPFAQSAWGQQLQALEHLAGSGSGGELSSGAPPRAVALSWAPSAGHDFGCALSEGSRPDSCEIVCQERDCADAYRHCIAHVECLGVSVDDGSNEIRATLKEYVVNDEAEPLVVCRSEADWKVAFAPHAKRGLVERSANQLLPGSNPYDTVGSSFDSFYSYDDTDDTDDTPSPPPSPPGGAEPEGTRPRSFSVESSRNVGRVGRSAAQRPPRNTER